MLRSTKSWLVAVLAIGLTLSLVTASQAAPLPGVYWSAQIPQDPDNGFTNQANIYYAPFSGTGLGTPVLMNTSGPITSAVNGISVAELGGDNYLFWAGCCNTQGIFRSKLTGTTMGPIVPLTGAPNGGGLAIDNVSAIPKGYYVINGNSLNQADPLAADATAFAASNVVVDTWNPNPDAFQVSRNILPGPTKVYYDSNTNQLTVFLDDNSEFNNGIVSIRGVDGLNSYTFSPDATAAQVLAGKATIPVSTVLGNSAGNNDGSVAYDPTTGQVYFIGQGGSGVEWNNAGVGQQIGSGASEIKQLSVDWEHGYLYFSDQNGTLGGSAFLQRINLSTLVQENTPFPGPDDVAGGQPNSVFVVMNELEAANGVPEPSTFVLAGLGLMGLGFFAWKKRRNA